MINQVILEGRLGRSPDILTTQEGRQIAKFSLATSSTWKDETGEWQQKTSWHSIVIHREPTIRWIQDVLKQGDLVHVEGRLTYHYWTDDSGKQRRKAQVVVSNQFGTVRYPVDQKQKSKTPEEQSAANSDLDQLSLRNIPFLSPQSNQHSQQIQGDTL